MAVRLNPHLHFRDQAREALTFYGELLGGTPQLSTFADMGIDDDPDEVDKVIHGLLDTGDGLVLMASDTPNAMDHTPIAGVSIALNGDDGDRLNRCWEELSATGEVAIPLETAPWGATFGMCTDRFGVTWMINIG